MNILCIGQVEDKTYIQEQIDKQTIQPHETILWVDDNPAQGIDERRKRISRNHHKLREIVKASDCDLVWQVEGDSELPENALERLLGHFYRMDDADFGYVSGVQVGRHGLYCLGAWNVKKDHTSFNSIDYNLHGIQQVDATGWYCLLAPREVWLMGNANWNGERFGPDVKWGLSLPHKKYVDMDLHIGHKVKSGIIRPSDASTCNARFYFEDGTWQFEQLS